jgi:hypothetical protein
MPTTLQESWAALKKADIFIKETWAYWAEENNV